MSEFVYFASYDVMLQSNYDAIQNTLRYSSHRGLRMEERVIIDAYMLGPVAQKLGYYAASHRYAVFIYRGVEARLLNVWRKYRETDDGVISKDAEIAVAKLLSASGIKVEGEK